MSADRARLSAVLVRGVVGLGVYGAIPLYATLSAAGFLAAEARTRASRAGRVTRASIRKIMVVVPRGLKRGRTRVTRAAQLHEFGRWVRKGQARYRKRASHSWTSMRKAARRTAAGGMRRLVRLRGPRGER